MNNSNFIQTGGYPLNAERLKEQQTAYAIFNSLGALAGNLTIISGCTLTGTIISNGVVFINGEVIDFREATLKEDSTVIIIQEEVKRPFKNGSIKTVNFIRYATFGTAETFWLWRDFKRVNPIIQMMERLTTLEKKSAVFQKGGGMVFWNKPATDIPAGWQEVVDWRGRMPVGLDVDQPEFNKIGKQEGSMVKNILKTHLPNIKIKVNPSGFRYGKNGAVQVGFFSSAGDSDAGGSGYCETDPLGDGADFNVMNPYRVVLFIEYIE
jgi:hypothetical protein